jgi:hypothetical protein
MLRETIYLGRENYIVLGLLIDGVEWSAAYLQRVTLTLQDDDGNAPITIDSDISPDAFSWDKSASMLDAVNPALIMKLGFEAIPPRDDYIGTLTVYTTTGPAGWVWDDRISIVVK